MKILIADRLNSSLHPTTWYSLPDSSLVNAGKPLYLPEFDSRFEAIPVMGVKISKLGKSVQEKFAHRYYTEIVPAVHFRASTLRTQLLSLGLPDGIATGFDRSLIAAPAVEAHDFFNSMPLVLLKNGSETCVLNIENPQELVDRVIETMSATNIIKIGDIIIPCLADAVDIEIGDSLILANSGKELLRIEIK